MCACGHTHIKHTGLGDSANILHVVQKLTLTLGGTVTKKEKLNREPEDIVFNSGYAKAAYFLCVFHFSFLKKKIIYQTFPKLPSNRHF